MIKLQFLYFISLQDPKRENLQNLKEVSVEEILEAQRVMQEEKQKQENIKVAALKERGIVPTLDFSHDDF